MGKKKVVLFINSLSSGGAEHQLVLLADGLVEKGYEVTIATFGDLPEHYSYRPEIKRKHLAPHMPNIIKMLDILLYFFTVNADCVISFGQRASEFVLFPIFFRPRNKIKVIAGERSTTFGEPTRLEKNLMGWLYKRADYIVPNSHAQRKHIVNRKPQYKEKTITITNYTELTKYVATPLPCGNTIRIGVFGRYDIAKNRLRFVEAIRILKEKSHQPFVVDWYGNKHFKGKINSLYVEMQNKVDEYCLSDCLVLNDHVKDVASTISHYDAVCLPSLWEGFSNAIGEAICCGRPCIVSDVGDNNVMVKDGKNGFLFNPLDVNSIVEAFLKFFAMSNEERKNMGIESRFLAEEIFDKESFINAYMGLIESQ